MAADPDLVAANSPAVPTSSADRARPSPDSSPCRDVAAAGLCPPCCVDRTAVSRTMTSGRARHRRRCAS